MSGPQDVPTTSSGKAKTRSGKTTKFMRELYRITKCYTAAAQVVPEPREIDLETLTEVGGADSKLERFICQALSRSTEWKNVTDDEIWRELDNYPEYVIPKDEDKECEIRQQYVGCVNRTATLLQDLEEAGGSDEIINDELFHVSFDRPTIVHRTFPVTSDDESAPDDIIFPITPEERIKLKRPARLLRVPPQEGSMISESPQKRRKI